MAIIYGEKYIVKPDGTRMTLKEFEELEPDEFESYLFRCFKIGFEKWYKHEYGEEVEIVKKENEVAV